MNDLVYRGESNQPLTNSKLVAEVFEKEHKNVIQSIRKLIEGTAQNSAVRQMFSESTYLNEQNKEQPMFVMNQDGFTLLAMGFNGKKAMEFKLKYIEAFNAMKKQIEQSKPSVPQNYLEALKSLVKAEEEKQQLALENKQKEKVEVFNIGTGRGLSVLELINAFEKATGVKLNYQIVGRRAGDIEKVWANPELANNELGWKAETSIEDTLLSAWKWQLKLRERGIQ